MLVAGLFAIAFFGLIVWLLVSNADALPKAFLKYLGYYILFGSTVEMLLLFWVLGYIGVSDRTFWGLPFNDFWREQLTAIYFVKAWIYTWFWNDLLDFFFVFVPAAAFLAVRTTITSALGFWLVAASKT